MIRIPSSYQDDISGIFITNTLGQRILSNSSSSNEGEDTSVDVSNLKQEDLFAEVVGAKRTQIGKFLKNKNAHSSLRLIPIQCGRNPGVRLYSAAYHTPPAIHPTMPVLLHSWPFPSR